MYDDECYEEETAGEWDEAPMGLRDIWWQDAGLNSGNLSWDFETIREGLSEPEVARLERAIGRIRSV